MRSNVLFVLGLLGTSAWAAPELKAREKRAVCNADNCLRAVRATSAKPSASSATADCSSFMQKTVTPCAATTTTTVTSTVTESPSFTTVTAVVDNTQINTAFETVVEVVQTIEDTVTFVQPTEVDVTNFIYTAVTVTAARAAGKRAVQLPPLPANPTVAGQALRRVVSASGPASAGTCAATTNAPSAVPTYASACSGTVRYSSACSCAGITGSTTTLAQSTVTATATSTLHLTPTSTVVATVTNNVPITIVQTQVVQSTFETTDATVIVQSAFTLSTDVVVPTTVVVSPPVCSSYKFVVADGPRAGQWLTSRDPNSSPNAIGYAFITFGDASNAKIWTIRPDQTIYTSDIFGWVTRNNALYYVLEMNDYSRSAYQINSVRCSVTNGGTSYQGAAGLLTCTFDNGTPTNLVSCPSIGINLLQSPNPSAAGNGCYKLNIAAVLSC